MADEVTASSGPVHPGAAGDTPGMMRRRMLAIASPGRVEAGLEDDFHHAEITLHHDGERVVEMTGTFPRPPFGSCPGTIDRLPDLVGLPISARAWQLPPDFAAKQHCTHMLDLALFTVAQAARGGSRQYDFEVPDAVPGVQRTALVRRDAVEVMRWTIEDKTILAPEPFAGRTMAELARWAQQTLDDEELETVTLLRRAWLVSGGRRRDGAGGYKVGDLLPRMLGACYTYQPQHADVARNIASLRDFTAGAEPLLADFRRRHGG